VRVEVGLGTRTGRGCTRGTTSGSGTARSAFAEMRLSSAVDCVGAEVGGRVGAGAEVVAGVSGGLGARSNGSGAAGAAELRLRGVAAGGRRGGSAESSAEDDGAAGAVDVSISRRPDASAPDGTGWASEGSRGEKPTSAVRSTFDTGARTRSASSHGGGGTRSGRRSSLIDSDADRGSGISIEAVRDRPRLREAVPTVTSAADGPSEREASAEGIMDCGKSGGSPG
jgi:hypothetical protein